MEGNAIGVEPHIAGLQHQVTRHFQFAAEFARKRPFRAFILHQDAAINPRAGRMARQLFQFLDAVEGEHGNTSLMRGSDSRHLLDGIAIGNHFRPCAGGKAGLHFFPGRRIKAGAKLHQPLKNRRARIGLHGIINARQGQCRTHGAVFFLDTIHIQHKAWRSRRVVAQKACDLRCHRSTLQAPGGHLKRRWPKVNETVERTSDQSGPLGRIRTGLPERLTSLRKPFGRAAWGQRHVRTASAGYVRPLLCHCKKKIALDPVFFLKAPRRPGILPETL